jgi:RecA/RadA recombinase
MSNSLLERLSKAGSIKHAQVLSDSFMFNMKDIIPSEIPIINCAFSGDIDGGFTTGLTILSGESKTFKTLLSLYCMKAYFDKYPDAIALFYDCEYGTTPAYFRSFGIDPNRVIHIPLEHVEQLKFDIVKRLEEIKRGDKVFILVDSLGALASKKEVEDAINENTAADMSRAKAIRSLLRIITPHLTFKDLPCVMVNHVYKEIGLYPKDVIPGGTAVTYAANQIFIISKAQEKDKENQLAGYRFTITIHKSRFVKEKSKFPFTVLYNSGIRKWSGLLDIAMETGHVIKPKVGWYQVVKPHSETGNGDTPLIEAKMFREKDMHESDYIWETIFEETNFKQAIKERYTLGEINLMGEDEEPNFDEEEIEDGDA